MVDYNFSVHANCFLNFQYALFNKNKFIWVFFGFSAAILFVSSVPERNRMDHVWMEKKIWELDQSIDVVYCSLTSLTSVMSIGRDKALFLLVFPISLS